MTAPLTAWDAELRDSLISVPAQPPLNSESMRRMVNDADSWNWPDSYELAVLTLRAITPVFDRLSPDHDQMRDLLASAESFTDAYDSDLGLRTRAVNDLAERLLYPRGFVYPTTDERNAGNLLNAAYYMGNGIRRQMRGYVIDGVAMALNTEPAISAEIEPWFRERVNQRSCSCDDHRRQRGELDCECHTCEASYNIRSSYHNLTSECNSCVDLRITEENREQEERWQRENEERERAQVIHGYSYRPRPNFLSAEDDPDEDKLYLGWELEVPSNDSEDLATSIRQGPGEDEKVLYGKYDGSIEGLEIVSHPMTHKWLREKFAFSMFRRNSKQSRLISGTPASGYGLHVHVSRKGFKNQQHALRWLLFVYRNERDMEKLARRGSGNWTSFHDAEACEQKAAGDKNGDRYVAVNAQNEHTFEIRVFRSTWNRQEFRAALDFAHASVKYTENLSSRAALTGEMSWSAFRAWLNEKPEYKDLIKEIDKRADEPSPSARADEDDESNYEDYDDEAVDYNSACECGNTECANNSR